MIMNIESSCSVFHFIKRFAHGYLSTKLVLIFSDIVIHHPVKRFSTIKKNRFSVSVMTPFGVGSLYIQPDVRHAKTSRYMRSVGLLCSFPPGTAMLLSLTSKPF